MKGISYMEELIRQVMEATRVIEIATTQINELKGRVHDLEVENQRLRDQLAIRSTQYDEIVEVNRALQSHAENLEARIRTNRDRIRRMEEGEL